MNNTKTLEGKTAQEWFDLGIESYKVGDNETTIFIFNLFTQLDSGYLPTYFIRGHAKYNLGLYQEAIEDYSIAIEINPEFAPAFHSRGDVKSKLGLHREAIEDYNKVFELNQDDEDALYCRSLAKSELGLYNEAIEDYDKVLELNPHNEDAFYYRGFAKNELGLYNEAIEDYDKVLELNPHNVDAYLNRGLAKSQLKLYQEAIGDFDKAIVINPKLALGVFGIRGLAKSGLKLYKEAVDDYDKAIEINPELASAFNNRGEAKCELKLYNEAIKDYDKAIEINPELAPAFHNRGFAKSELKLFQKAIEDYDKAIELSAKFALAFYNRGLAKMNLKLYKEAIKDYDKAIEINPELAPAFHNRGIAKSELKLYQEAIENYNIAISIDSKFALVFLNRCLAFEILGNYGTSELDFNRFLYLTDANSFFENSTTVLRYFNERTTPFLTWHTLKKFTDFEHLGLIDTLISETERHCAPLLRFLKLLQFNGEDVKNPTQYNHAEAHINFYMRDPSVAYTIYDQKIDIAEHPINLMGQYYYIESAKLFGEPYQDILDFALDDIAKKKEALLQDGNLRELYYAGLIHLKNESFEQALNYFELAQTFLPAAYGILLAYHTINQNLSQDPENYSHLKRISNVTFEAQRQKVYQLDIADKDGGFRHGFKKHFFTTETTDYFNVLQHYAHFREISETISDVRNHTEQFEFYQMWDAFTWREADLEKLNYQIHLRETIQRSAELLENFKIELELHYLPETIEQLRAILEDKINRAYVKNTEALVFEKLLRDAKDGKNMEERLGDIFTFRNYDASIKSILLEFFYLNGNLKAEEVFFLYFYLGVTEKRINYLEGFGAEVNFEISKKIIDLLIDSTYTAGQIFTAGAAQAFVQLGKGFLQWRKEEESLLSLDDDPREESYANFKKNFFHFMMVEKEKLGEEFFYKRFPLHGFEDWRKKK